MPQAGLTNQNGSREDCKCLEYLGSLVRLCSAQGVERYKTKNEYGYRGCNGDGEREIRPAHRGLHICDPVELRAGLSSTSLLHWRS